MILTIFQIRQIHLYPCGDRDDKDHVTCYFHYLDDNEEEFSARWKAVFLTKTGESLRLPLGEINDSNHVNVVSYFTYFFSRYI